MSDIKRVYDFIEEADVVYLSTIDGDRPRCRPVSFKMFVDGKIYFGVGTFKDVYKQMEINPHVEITAYIENSDYEFIRYFGTAVGRDDDEELLEKAFEVLPFLRNIYNDETGYTYYLFYLDDAVCEFRSMEEYGASEILEFKY